MFNPSRVQVRKFFFETWGKYRAATPLQGLETVALEVALCIRWGVVALRHPHHLAQAFERRVQRIVPGGAFS